LVSINACQSSCKVTVIVVWLYPKLEHALNTNFKIICWAVFKFLPEDRRTNRQGEANVHTFALCSCESNWKSVTSAISIWTFWWTTSWIEKNRREQNS
jgi:hypothetical protein